MNISLFNKNRDQLVNHGNGHSPYKEFISRFQEFVRQALPLDSKVIIVSNIGHYIISADNSAELPVNSR